MTARTMRRHCHEKPRHRRQRRRPDERTARGLRRPSRPSTARCMAVEPVDADASQRNESPRSSAPPAAASAPCCAALNRMHETGPPARASRAASCWTARTSTRRASTRCACAGTSGWSSSSPTRFPTMRSSTTSPPGCELNGVRDAPSARAIVEECAAAGGAVGRGQGPAQRAGVWRSPAASSSASASPARWRSQPDVLLMDEPCSALDPIATLQIEDLMRRAAREYTIVIVTHNMQQAARVSDLTPSSWLGAEAAGELVEFGATDADLHRPAATSAPRTTSPGRVG